MSAVVVPVSRDQARAFVREHHRHNRRPPSAEVLRAGLAVDGDLVAVALAGVPARELRWRRDLVAIRAREPEAVSPTEGMRPSVA